MSVEQYLLGERPKLVAAIAYDIHVKGFYLCQFDSRFLGKEQLLQ
jgi:hypothetical protein